MSSSYDSPFYKVAVAVLAAMSVALLDSARGSPATSFIADTDPDWDDCCGDDGKGRLVVWLEDAYPYAVFPQRAQTAMVCRQGFAVNVVAQVLRCATGPDWKDDDLQAQARALWDDVWAMTRALCALADADWLVFVTNMGPVGEEGGCVGVEARLAIAVK